MAVKTKRTVKGKRRERKFVEFGQAHIRSSFTIRSSRLQINPATQFPGQAPAVSGFRGSKKSTPFAAQSAAETAAKAAMEHGLEIR